MSLHQHAQAWLNGEVETFAELHMTGNPIPSSWLLKHKITNWMKIGLGQGYRTTPKNPQSSYGRVKI